MGCSHARPINHTQQSNPRTPASVSKEETSSAIQNTDGEWEPNKQDETEDQTGNQTKCQAKS